MIGAQQGTAVMRNNVRIVLERAGRPVAEVDARYRKEDPELPDNLLAEAMETDRFYRVPVLRMAEGHSRAGGRTFVYEFSYSSDSEFGAGHCGELPFVFERPDCALVRTMTSAPAPAGLMDAMHGAWAAFARTGRPAGPGLPEWPEYNPASRATMVFDHPACTVAEDPRADQRAAWDGVI